MAARSDRWAPAWLAPPPTLLVLGAIASVQLGAALAKNLFDQIGVAGTVALRVALAAALLLALFRPSITRLGRGDLMLLAAFGAALAGMNLAFYEAIDRIPLGVAVTLEFLGPLGVATFGSRRRLDLAWVALAAVGVALLGGGGGGAGLDPVGVAAALVAGLFWAAYIVLTARIGQQFASGDGLALAMGVAAILLLPVGLRDAGAALLDARVLLLGLVVALVSAAIPFSLELEALRRMPSRVFGILMSLEPAVAALVGFVLLGEALAAHEWLAVATVIAASAGSTATARRAGRAIAPETPAA